MKTILQNSIVFILFLCLFLSKDFLYNFFYGQKEINLDYLKTNETNYYKNEYEKLSNSYEIDYIKENDYVYSKIISRDVYSFYNEMIIFHGKDRGLKKGDAVVSQDGLVGIIKDSNKNSSYVRLLYDSNLKISVKINDSYGILESKEQKLVVTNLTKEAIVNVGDIIYTSGLTSIMGEIPVAKVTKINLSKDQLELVVEAEELVNLKDINYVVVIKAIEG